MSWADLLAVAPATLGILQNGAFINDPSSNVMQLHPTQQQAILAPLYNGQYTTSPSSSSSRTSSYARSSSAGVLRPYAGGNNSRGGFLQQTNSLSTAVRAPQQQPQFTGDQFIIEEYDSNPTASGSNTTSSKLASNLVPKRVFRINKLSPPQQQQQPNKPNKLNSFLTNALVTIATGLIIATVSSILIYHYQQWRFNQKYGGYVKELQAQFEKHSPDAPANLNVSAAPVPSTWSPSQSSGG